MSGPASFFLLAVSVFALSDLLSDPVPYISPVASDFGVVMRSLLQSSNLLTTSSRSYSSLQYIRK